MTKYLIGIDRGHSGVRAGCFDTQGRLVSGANIDVPGRLQGFGGVEEIRAAAVAGENDAQGHGAVLGIPDQRPPRDAEADAGDGAAGVRAGQAVHRGLDGLEEYTAAVTTPVPWMLSNILYLRDRFPGRGRKSSCRRSTASQIRSTYFRAIGS